MKFLISLAWKNLSRYRKRTIITALTIAVGIGVFIWVDAWLLGMDRDSIRNLIWFETGSAKVIDTAYWEEQERLPLKYTVENPEEIAAEIESLGYMAAPRTMFTGEIIVYEDPYPAGGSLQARFTALDPKRDPEVFRIDEYIAEGRYLEPGEDGVLLGSLLAKDLKAEVGYPLTVKTRTRDGAFQTFDLEVVGIVNTPNPIVNRTSAFIPLQTADAYLYMEGSTTEVAIHFPETKDTDKAMEQINAAIAGTSDIEAKSWKILGEDYVALSTMKTAGSKVILFLVFVIAAVGISNTMLMAVYERIKEIGMMRAMGMKDSAIRLTFMFEAAGIGFIGATAGLILGIISTFWIVNWGIDFSAMTADMDIGYRIAGEFRGAWNPGTMVTAFFAGIIIAMMVAWIPSGKALKKEITECLRYQ